MISYINLCAHDEQWQEIVVAVNLRAACKCLSKFCVVALNISNKQAGLSRLLAVKAH